MNGGRRRTDRQNPMDNPPFWVVKSVPDRAAGWYALESIIMLIRWLILRALGRR
jgi:hypothetical protein